MPEPLTDLFVRQVKPSAKRQQFRDAKCSNLALRVEPSGKKTWTALFRIPGASDKLSKHGKPLSKEARARLGVYKPGDPDHLTLEKARDQARHLAREARQTRQHPIEAARNAEQEERSNRERELENTINLKFDIWMDKDVKVMINGQPAVITWRDYETIYRLHIKPFEIAELPLTSITTADLHHFIDGHFQAGHPGRARKVLKLLKLFFAWCALSGYVPVSPLADYRHKRLFARTEVGRPLTEDEIQLYWKAASAQGYPYGHLWKVLLLTGMRLREVGELRLGELFLDDKLIQLPRERFKSGVQYRNSMHLRADAVFTVPVTDTLQAVLEETMDWAKKIGLAPGKAEHLFSKRGAACTAPIAYYGKSGVWRNQWVSRHIADEKLEIALPPKPPRAHHDLRVTCKTMMADLGIQEEVSAACLGHSKTGMSRIYNKSAYLEQKRIAYDVYHARLMEIVS